MKGAWRPTLGSVIHDCPVRPLRATELSRLEDSCQRLSKPSTRVQDAVRDGVSISEDRQYHVRQLTAIQLWLE